MMLLAALHQCAASPRDHAALSTAAFRDLIGVNTHLQYGSTSYADVARVEAALAYVGIDHVRDSAFRAGERGWDRYLRLARRGVRFDLFFNGDLLTQLGRTERLAAAAPGSVDLVEGPNEVNNDAVSWPPLRGDAAAEAFQDALRGALRTRPDLESLPLAGFTDWPPVRSDADLLNVHSYAKRADPPGRQLGWDLALAQAADPAKSSFVVTETGFPTLATPDQVRAVDDAAQAERILEVLAEGARFNARRVYIYELFDEGVRAYDAEQHYGLFDVEGHPKLAARELAALHTQLLSVDRDDGPRSSDALTQAQDADLRTLSILGRHGRSILVSWRKSGTAAKQRLILDQPMSIQELDLTRGSAYPATCTRRLESEQARTLAIWRLEPCG